MDLSIVPQLFAFGILLLQADLLIVVLAYIFDRNGWVVRVVHKYAIPIVGLMGLFAIIGSLTLSEGLGWTPCKLCWFQRIFLYPSFFIGLIAWWKQDRNALRYTLVLSIVGVLISIYHYYLQMSGTTSLPCSVMGQGPSCGGTFIKQFGYMTIPMMALTLAAYAGVISWIGLRRPHNEHTEKPVEEL